MALSSITTTWRGVSSIWPWSSRQVSDARVREASMPAWCFRVLAAWPEVEVPMTSKPSASNASRTAASAVVLPAPATPTTCSTPRPEVVMAMTAERWPRVRETPSSASLWTIALRGPSGRTAGASVRATSEPTRAAMACSVAMVVAVE